MTAPAPRPAVERMHAYVPGEQPKGRRLVKLNTNENNYPPSPGVTAALAAIAEHRVSRYPDPLCVELRRAIAQDLRLTPEHILMGNGSDEVLKMAVEAYADEGQTVGYLWPTYSLYPVFVEKQACREVRLPWLADGKTQEEALLAAPKGLKVAFITNPNPPVGLPVPLEIVRQFAADRPQTLVVCDEAYIAYGGESAIELVREGARNVLVTRTFSKSHSLAGMRVGFAAGHPDIMQYLFRVKDSYNLNVAAQAAALAAWQDAAWTDDKVRRIVADRDRTAADLRGLGFEVPPSCGNFLFAKRADAPELFPRLREEGILVRWFDTPELREGLRISIGTSEEMDEFLTAIRKVAG